MYYPFFLASLKSIAMSEAVKQFTATYGPFAFGIVSLLILWISILKPQLDRQNLDYEAHRKIIEQQNATLDSQKALLRDQDRLSENMKQASLILERVVSELNNKAIESAGAP